MLYGDACLSSFSARLARRLTAAATAALFLFANVDASYASAPWDAPAQYGSVSPAGMAAMLRLRIPFGGDATHRSRPTLSLSAQTVWRDESLPLQFGRLQYASGLEAGFTFGDSPILRLGSIDMLNGEGPRLNAIQNDQGTPNWVWWVLGGAAVVTIVALAVASNQKKSSDYFVY